MQQARINYVVLAHMFWLERARVRVMKEMISCAMVIDCLRISNQWHSAISGQVLFVTSYVIIFMLGSSFLGTTVGNVLFDLNQVKFCRTSSSFYNPNNFYALSFYIIVAIVFLLWTYLHTWPSLYVLRLKAGEKSTNILISFVCIIVHYISLKLWLISIYVV